MKHTEDSIRQAYLSLIENAKHYVYIENQFFVSLANDVYDDNTGEVICHKDDVLNDICAVLCKRIVNAHK